MKTSASCKISL